MFTYNILPFEMPPPAITTTELKQAIQLPWWPWLQTCYNATYT